MNTIHRRPAASGDLGGSGRRWPDVLFHRVVGGAGLVVLVVLGLMVVSTTVESWPALREAGSGFLTLDRWAPNLNSFGALSMVQGTFTVSVIAVVLAVPVSIGIALFTTEVAPHGLRGPLTVLVDLLAAVPSVIYGLWGIL